MVQLNTGKPPNAKLPMNGFPWYFSAFWDILLISCHFPDSCQIPPTIPGFPHKWQP